MNQPIAIVGMACRFPGRVDSPRAFWQLLTAGTDAITEVPEGRWNASRFHHPNAAALRGGWSRAGADSSRTPTRSMRRSSGSRRARRRAWTRSTAGCSRRRGRRSRTRACRPRGSPDAHGGLRRHLAQRLSVAAAARCVRRSIATRTSAARSRSRRTGCPISSISAAPVSPWTPPARRLWSRSISRREASGPGNATTPSSAAPMRC